MNFKLSLTQSILWFYDFLQHFSLTTRQGLGKILGKDTGQLIQTLLTGYSELERTPKIHQIQLWNEWPI